MGVMDALRKWIVGAQAQGVSVPHQAGASVWPPLPDDPFVLFLDIDGVLHRAENGSLEWMPHLNQLLDAFPALALVLSTNWRLNVTQEAMLALFPQSIRMRIHGATPDLSDGAPFLRERECRAWANKHGVLRYVALDDEPAAFRPGCDFLLVTNRYDGLDASMRDTCILELTRRGCARANEKSPVRF